MSILTMSQFWTAGDPNLLTRGVREAIYTRVQQTKLDRDWGDSIGHVLIPCYFFLSFHVNFRFCFGQYVQSSGFSENHITLLWEIFTVDKKKFHSLTHSCIHLFKFENCVINLSGFKAAQVWPPNITRSRIP